MKSTSTLTTVLVLTLAASATAQRETAKASWKEGKMTVSYGAPPWRAEHGEAMAKRPTWRLGMNNPTRVKLTCALLTDSGCIPAGEYGMALQKNEKGKWDLVVYKAGPGQHYNKAIGGWLIKPTSSKAADATAGKVADKLTIKISDQKQLSVHFGPHISVYSLAPVKMHAPIKAEFATIPTVVKTMARPVGKSVKNMVVGEASLERNGVKVSWDMSLTIDGDSATLAFENTGAAAIPGKKKQIASLIKRVKGMIEGAGEQRRKSLEDFLAGQEKEMKKLEDAERMSQSFKTKHNVTGKVADLDEAASTLTVKSERVDGGLVLTYGAGKKTVTFKITPRDFRERRRRN